MSMAHNTCIFVISEGHDLLLCNFAQEVLTLFLMNFHDYSRRELKVIFREVSNQL